MNRRVPVDRSCSSSALSLFSARSSSQSDLPLSSTDSDCGDHVRPPSRSSFTQIPDAAGQPQGRNLTVHPAAKTQQLPVSLKVWIWIRRRLVTCQSVCDRTVTDSWEKPCWLEVRLSPWKQFYTSCGSGGALCRRVIYV